MSEIYSAVKNLIFFLLLTTVVSNLLGKSSFKKYLHIFVGLIVILIVIKPILSWTNMVNKVDHYYDLNVYQSDSKDISAEIVGAEKGYQNQVVISYKNAIKNQIQVLLSNYGLTVKELTVDIEENIENENCGRIYAITLQATKKEKEESTKKPSIAPIDQVTIDKVKLNENTNIDQSTKGEETQKMDRYDTVLELSIKEELVSLYGVPYDHLSVSITE